MPISSSLPAVASHFSSVNPSQRRSHDLDVALSIAHGARRSSPQFFEAMPSSAYFSGNYAPAGSQNPSRASPTFSASDNSGPSVFDVPVGSPLRRSHSRGALAALARWFAEYISNCIPCLHLQKTIDLFAPGNSLELLHASRLTCTMHERFRAVMYNCSATEMPFAYRRCIEIKCDVSGDSRSMHALFLSRTSARFLRRRHFLIC